MKLCLTNFCFSFFVEWITKCHAHPLQHNQNSLAASSRWLIQHIAPREHPWPSHQFLSFVFALNSIACSYPFLGYLSEWFRREFRFEVPPPCLRVFPFIWFNCICFIYSTIFAMLFPFRNGRIMMFIVFSLLLNKYLKHSSQNRVSVFIWSRCERKGHSWSMKSPTIMLNRQKFQDVNLEEIEKRCRRSKCLHCLADVAVITAQCLLLTMFWSFDEKVMKRTNGTCERWLNHFSRATR